MSTRLRLRPRAHRGLGSDGCVPHAVPVTVGDRTAGELMFEAYLREQGYAVPAHEPDLGVTKRPDYVVERDGWTCVCEVKEFARDTTSMPGIGAEGAQFGSFDSATVLKPIRSQIREGARQLKPLADSGHALMVVIANPHGAWVDCSDQQVVAAMYGDPVIRLPIDTGTGIADGEPIFDLDRNGKLRADHQYVSAVGFVRVRERASDAIDQINQRLADKTSKERLEVIYSARDRGELPEGSYHRIDVFKTLSPSAVPVPMGLFDGPKDRLLGYDEESGAYIQIRGPRFS